MPFIHAERRMNYGGMLTACEDDLPLLHRAGIRAVVSLLNLQTYAAAYESAGFAFLCLPVPDGKALTMSQADGLVRFIVCQRAEQRPVAVHCEAGLGRTGTALAIYLISQGCTAEIAIQQIRTIEKAAIETKRQIKFLEEYAEAQNR